MGNRADDTFLRKIIWFLIGASIVSTGGWIWTVAVTQHQVQTNTEAVKEIKGLQKTMLEINSGVVVLVALSKERNEQQKLGIKRQNFIFGEQQRRTPMIAWIERKMGLSR